MLRVSLDAFTFQLCSALTPTTTPPLTGFACPPGTGALSALRQGCTSPLAYCPVGSSAPVPTPTGFFAIALSAGALYFNASICVAGRHVWDWTATGNAIPEGSSRQRLCVLLLL